MSFKTFLFIPFCFHTAGRWRPLSTYSAEKREKQKETEVQLLKVAADICPLCAVNHERQKEHISASTGQRLTGITYRSSLSTLFLHFSHAAYSNITLDLCKVRSIPH